MRYFIFLFFLMIVVPQQSSAGVGMEFDLVPFATGGYSLGVWVEGGGFRGRGMATYFLPAQYTYSDRFKDHAVESMALALDYFLSGNMSEWWLSLAYERWIGKIKIKETGEEARYDTPVATLGGGYLWNFWSDWYVSPGIAVHVATTKRKADFVADTYEVPYITPELSIKFGFAF